MTAFGPAVGPEDAVAVMVVRAGEWRREHAGAPPGTDFHAVPQPLQLMLLKQLLDRASREGLQWRYWPEFHVTEMLRSGPGGMLIPLPRPTYDWGKFDAVRVHAVTTLYRPWPGHRGSLE